MILRPVRPVSPCGPPMTKRPVGLMWYLVSASSRLRGNHGLDDVLQNVGAQFVVADGLGVLRRDHDGVDADRLAVLVVFHRDLASCRRAGGRAACRSCGLRSGAAVSLWASDDRASASAPGFSLQCVAEHHALVAGAARVHAHGDVAGLLVDAGDHGAGVGVEAVKGVVIADGLARRRAPASGNRRKPWW